MSYSSLVIEGYDAWNRGNRQWIIGHMSSEVEWVAADNDPDARIYLGPEQIEQFWDQWRAAVGQLRFEPIEVSEQDDEVVAVARRQGRGAHSGLEVSDEVVQVFSFDADGKCYRVREFNDREEAIQTLRLGDPGRWQQMS